MNNESIYAEFEKIALDLIARGHKHFSSDGVCHILRYFTSVHGTDPTFKLNNNETAKLAREFIQKHPEHKNFFQLRRSKVDFTFEGDQRVFA